MRKFYSIVLMATALLIGTNAWADVADWAELVQAINDAPAGVETTIKLDAGESKIISADVSTSADSWAGIWIGTADEDGTAKKIILDLNGHNLIFKAGKNAQTLFPFVLTKGELKIKSDSPAQISVQAMSNNSTIGASTNVFSVFGTYNKVDPQGKNPFSRLEIGKNVSVSTLNGTVVAVDALYNYISNGTIKQPAPITALSTPTSYATDYYAGGYGFAFGVHIDIEGNLSSQGGSKCYGIKTNGLLEYPGSTRAHHSPAHSWMSSYSYSADDAKYAPYVYVGEDANVTSDANYLASGSTAIYCSGYANWVIEGTCQGATGVFISSGDVDIQGDAVITSTATEYHAGEAGGHAKGSGSAIVINSRDAYAGEVALEISDDVAVTASTGYAIDEVVNTKKDGEGNQTTKVENITINGGTFKGGSEAGEDKPAIIISSVTAGDQTSEVVVLGGNVVNGAQVGESGGIEKITPSTVHTTEVTIDGKKVTVVSEGQAPTGDANVAAGHNAESSVKWTGAAELLSANLELAELEINEASAQVLNIGDADHKVTFKVGRLVLGANAQVVVNPGSKLIVNGKQGFIAASPNNFLLKTQEGNPAIFLFHPEVETNRHPSATVEFISKSITNGSVYTKQRFGIPTFGALESIETKYEGSNVQTALSKFNYEGNEWVDFGWINIAGKDENLDQLSNPFEYYQMQHNTPNMGTVVTMKGKLYGNESPALSIRGNYWNGFANSYMAPIKGSELIQMIPETVDKAFYLYDVKADYAVWKSVTLIIPTNLPDIAPMQPFLIRNTMEAADVMVDYADAVYYPTTGETKPSASPAPARRSSLDNITRAQLTITGENGVDYVVVAADDQFTPEFDNGYDAVKFMNDGINMYVSADEKMANFATDDLNNTYVGLQTVNGGNYTIDFSYVQGEELVLIDHETGARVAMVEGATYEFTANGTNDYRFEIVGRANMPTAIENTEAVKSAKGVYTITGQYVGEMNVWNALPAGVYVVNGEKRVK